MRPARSQVDAYATIKTVAITTNQTFTASELREWMLSRKHRRLEVKNSQQILHRLYKKGWIKRMSKGVYALP